MVEVELKIALSYVAHAIEQLLVAERAILASLAANGQPISALDDTPIPSLSARLVASRKSWTER